MSIDWDNLTFSLNPSKTMYVATTNTDGGWNKGELRPYGNISISPAAGVLNYGQGVFEGMKAHRTKSGDIVLFRPEENAKRINVSAERVCIPPFPEQQFIDAIEQLIWSNEEYIPPYDKGSLYFRPCLWGTGPKLGVAPAPDYTFLTYVSPVGAYFKSGIQPTKMEVCTNYHRAANKGIGHAKYIGNYASIMIARKAAQARGYNDCIYCDDSNAEYIEEAGASNIFCVINGTLVTPELGKILPGITRDSIITMARDILGLNIEERPVSIKELLTASECFCAGTAAIITPIGMVKHEGKETTFNNFKTGPITQTIYESLRNIQLCEADDPFGWVTCVSKRADVV